MATRSVTVIPHPSSFILCAALLAALVGGCARIPTGVTPIKAQNTEQLQKQLQDRAPSLDQFRVRGPFGVEQSSDLVITLPGGERVTADLYLSNAPGKLPLVILMHGYDNTKADHAYQAFHVASWGMHSLAISLPTRARWQGNGRSLTGLVNTIQRRPEVLDPRIDTSRIIIAAHSFGAISTSVALAEGAPAMGGILLDPAAIGKEVPGFIRRINKPLMVVGADPRVSVARERDNFFRFARGGVTEVSIKGAAHEDAQFPMGGGLMSFASGTTEEYQLTFVAALTAAAFSLSSYGTFDYAWRSFRPGLDSGKLINPRRK